MMDLEGQILYKIGIDHSIERGDLMSWCLKKFPDCPPDRFEGLVRELIGNGTILAFGHALSLPSEPSEVGQDAPSAHPFPKIMIGVGAIALAWALLMDVSVPVSGASQGVRVNNAGLMNSRIVISVTGIGLLLGGILLVRKD